MQHLRNAWWCKQPTTLFCFSLFLKGLSVTVRVIDWGLRLWFTSQAYKRGVFQKVLKTVESQSRTTCIHHTQKGEVNWHWNATIFMEVKSSAAGPRLLRWFSLWFNHVYLKTTASIYTGDRGSLAYNFLRQENSIIPKKIQSFIFGTRVKKL